jgi:hypothetical protein
VIHQAQDIKQDIGLVESGSMAFVDIFKDKNEFNEKTIIGFMSFAVMTLYSLTDLITGYMGMELPINDFVYNSFLYITLGCFGIAGVEKVMGNKDAK